METKWTYLVTRTNTQTGKRDIEKGLDGSPAIFEEEQDAIFAAFYWTEQAHEHKLSYKYEVYRLTPLSSDTGK